MTNKKLNLKNLSKLFFLETCGFLVFAGIIHFTAPYFNTPEQQEAARVLFYGCIIMSPLTGLMGIHCWRKAKRLEKKDEEVINYKPIS